MARLYAGTSGFAYGAWKGGLYPAGLDNDEMLSYYAGVYPSVEINSSFYGLPSQESLERWRDAVPEGFCFALKLGRRITHKKRLQDVTDEIAFCLQRFAVLGGRLGPLLLQIPQSLPPALDRLQPVLAEISPEYRLAVQAPPRWHGDALYELLERYGAALCGVDDPSRPLDARNYVKTAPFAYLRLRRVYDHQSLSAWSRPIGEWLAAQNDV